MSSPLNIRLNIDARSNGFDKARADARSLSTELEKANRTARAAGAGSALPPGRQSAAAAAIYGRSPLAAGTIAAGGDLRGYKGLYYGGAAFATVTAARSLIERGVEFNKTLETGRLGLAALMRSARGDMFADFNSALAEADKAFVLIRKEISTKGLPTTLKDFIGAYSGAATAMYEADIPLEKQVKLIGQITKAISTMGLSADQATQEARALFSGNITKDAMVARRLNITGESINAAKAQGRLESYLTEKFSVFGAALDAGKNTLTAKLAQLTNELDAFAGKLAERYGEAIKEGVDKLTEAFKNVDPAMLREAGRIAEQGLRLVTGAAGFLVNNMNVLATSFRDMVGLFAVSKLAGMVSPMRGGGFLNFAEGSVGGSVAAVAASKAADAKLQSAREQVIASTGALYNVQVSTNDKLQRDALAHEIRMRRAATVQQNAMARAYGQRMVETNIADLEERRLRAAANRARVNAARADLAQAIEAQTIAASGQAAAAAAVTFRTRALAGFATMASAVPWVALGYTLGDVLITSLADNAIKATNEMSKTFEAVAEASKSLRESTTFQTALAARDSLAKEKENAGKALDAFLSSGGSERNREQLLNGYNFASKSLAEAEKKLAGALAAEKKALASGASAADARKIAESTYAADTAPLAARQKAAAEELLRISSEKDFSENRASKEREYRDMLLANAEIMASDSQSTVNRVLKASAGSDQELARTRLIDASGSRASLDYGVTETRAILDAYQSVQKKLLLLSQGIDGTIIRLSSAERNVAGLKPGQDLSASTRFYAEQGIKRFDAKGTKASLEEGEKLQRSLAAADRRALELRAKEGTARRSVSIDNAIKDAEEALAAAKRKNDIQEIATAENQLSEARSAQLKLQEDIRKGEERVNKARFGLLSTTGRLMQNETDLEQTLKDAAAQRKAGNILEAQQLELDAVAMVKASQGKVKAPEQVGLRVSDFTDRFSRIGAVTGIGFRADNQDTVAVDTLQLQRKQHSLMEKYLPKLDTIATNLGGGSTIQDA